MTKFFLIITFSLLFKTLFAQDFGYAPGTIITNQNDTINCYVEMAIAYDNKVSYKNTELGDTKYFRKEEIKSISTPYNFYERIVTKKKDKIMMLLIDGNAKLYKRVGLIPGYPQSIPGGTYQHNAPVVTYVLFKNNIYIDMNKKKLKEIGVILSDCPELSKKISSKKVKLEELEGIVKEFNSCMIQN